LAFIAGPCVIESRDHTLRMADELSRLCRKLAIPLIFKASFDKANRTSADSFRGVAVDKACEIFWLSHDKRTQVVECLTESASTGLTGAAKNTVTKLAVEIGKACDQYQRETLRDLPCTRIKSMKSGRSCTRRRRTSRISGSICPWATFGRGLQSAPTPS
jgi:hypothetical protein